MTVQLSVAIMHHPSRADRIGELVRSCAPLAARVVTDPDPGGPPSPLRTAKKAWAAIEPGATHHLVLQDDIHLMPGFGHQLPQAVAAQPSAALTLYVNWHSTPNSYFVRRAVESGSAWAPLFPGFVPTLGLVLPVDEARALAGYLETVPDDVRHDDRAIATFVADRAIPVLAAVPHLLEHGTLSSVAGNELDGERHAAVFTDTSLPSGYWETSSSVLGELADRAAHRRSGDFAVEFHNSETRLRFARPGAGEHIWHPFGWYWHDWCDLVGVDRDDIAGTCPLPTRLGMEIWAAGYLLGADTANPRAERGVLRADLLKVAFESWLKCGLLPEDQASLTRLSARHLANLGVAAVAQGNVARERNGILS
ncbi:hypothetical protein SAMN05421504_11395 [Amycolatopsis xylanica]|uniref:Uncharacterized protein n=1 Tax=Amycolatopsis xylanica TaxID=589385 RepID=A0A1H3SC04_9PSEU|nr:hypothetical protein [Amycolatopsis xylanica]SDZ35237.1 hypothetical protein SAMN05421504_11395 [Amycolatopsis xylanica]